MDRTGPAASQTEMSAQARTAEKRGGGGSPWGSPAGRGRPAAAGAVLAGLAALLAAPPAAAQTCTAGYTGTLPTVTYSGAVTGKIECGDLTGGLTLTVAEGATVGTLDAPGDTAAVFADGHGSGDSAGANDITIVNSGTLHGVTRGISAIRDGTGLLAVEHRAGRIVLTAESADTRGINAYHGGQANTVTKGIRIVSAADIDLSGANEYSGDSNTIFANTQNSAAGTTIPITIDVTSGTLSSRGHESSIYVYQFAKGRVAVNIAGGVTVDSHRTGIQVERYGNKEGDIAVTAAKGSVIRARNASFNQPGHGIYLRQRGSGDIAVEAGGRIEAYQEAIYVRHLLGTSAGDITVTVTEDGVLKGRQGVSLVTVANGDITVTNSGRIEAESLGLNVEHRTVGMMRVVHSAGGRIVVGGANEFDSGISVFYEGGTHSYGAGDVRGMTVESAGDIESASRGILARAYNKSGVDRKIPVSVHVRGGTVKSAHHGIHAETRRYDSGDSGTHTEHAGGLVTVTVDRGAAVVSGRDGILVDGALLADGMRAQTVTVRGRVTGGGKADDGTGYAGVHMVKGGKVVVGPMAYVGAESGVAVKANDEGDMTVILERDMYGLAGHVDGKVANTATSSFRVRSGEDGAAETLSVGDRVDMRGETRGVYDTVHRTRLATVTGGHEFAKLSETRLHHDRARVYEALPSVLLDLVLTSPVERVAAARGGERVWARLGAGDGKRRAAGSTTGKGYRGVALAWDTERREIEAGLDLPAGDRLALGLGVRHLRGKATVKEGGRIDVSGLGLGLSVAHTGAGGLYIDGRLSHIRFGDIDLASDARGGVASNLSGDGFAAGVGVGRRIARERVALTPRGGLAWSSVSLGAFEDVAGVEGGGRVVPGRTRSLRGGLGVLAEFGGSEGSSGRAFASLDLEHEFAPDREVVASGTALSSKVRATWVRLGLGGALDLDSSGAVRLSGRGHYATAGSGNTGYGGSVTLTLRF